MALHPAENRGYRELYAFARQVADHWPKLAERMAGSSAEQPMRAGAATASELLAALESMTPQYGLYGKPAAQGVGKNLATARRNVRDRFLERNQALRFAVSDMQHLVTLLGYLEQVARSRGDDTLRTFCSEQRGKLMHIERTSRAAAMELGSSPDDAIKPVDDSTAGRAAHGVGFAMGSVGEWLDRRASS